MSAELKIQIIDDSQPLSAPPQAASVSSPAAGPVAPPAAVWAPSPTVSAPTVAPQPSPAPSPKQTVDRGVASPLSGLKALAAQLGFGRVVSAVAGLTDAAKQLSRVTAPRSSPVQPSSSPPVAGQRVPRVQSSQGARVAAPVFSPAEPPPPPTMPPLPRLPSKGLAQAAVKAVRPPPVAAGVVRGVATIAARGVAAPVAAGVASAAGGAAAGAAAGGVAGGAAAGGVAAMAGLAAAAGPAGIAIGALVAVTGLAVAGVKKFGKAIEEEAVRLSSKSAELSMATAQTDINRQMADMRRAEQIGPRLAKFERIRSSAETAMYEIGTEIKDLGMRVLEIVAPMIHLIEPISEGIQYLIEGRRALSAKADEWMARATLNTEAAAKYAAQSEEHLKRMRAIMEGDDNDKLDDITKAFLSMDIMGPAGGPRAPIRLPAGVAGGT